MTVPFLNPGAQFAGLRDALLAALESSLARGHFILGPNVTAFEAEAAAYLGVRYAVGVNSGSDALTLALKALGIGPGDEVVTSPFTYIAPAEAIHQVGAQIVFADIDPKTFCLDPLDVARRISIRTRAVIPVHLFGQAADLDALAGAIGDRDIAVVEDCAQSIGAERNGRRVGGSGRVGCFSFYPTKNLGAAGDGGLCVTDDEGTAKTLRMLRIHGIEKRYHHKLHGFNSRLDDIQAAILRVKLPYLDAWNARRQEIAKQYTTGLADLPLQVPVTGRANTHIYHVYAVLTDRRDALQTHLAANGVPTLIYYPLPLHLQEVYADQGWKAGDFPVAEATSARILPLPMYPELSDEQVDWVIAKMREFFVS